MGLFDALTGKYGYICTTPSGQKLKNAPYDSPEAAVDACEKYITDHAVGYGTFYISVQDMAGNDVAAVQFDKNQVVNPNSKTGYDITTNEAGGTLERGGGAAGNAGGPDTQDVAVTKGLEANAKEETPWGLIIVAIIIIAVIIGGVMLWRKG